MGEPILEGPKVPTTLQPTQGSTVVQQTLTVDGRSYEMTCVSMGNPHAITYTVDGKPIKVR
jgi:diaminopimelate epimerase